MQFEKIQIKVTGKQQGEVRINGERLNCVQRVDFSFGVRQMPTVVIELLSDDVEVVGCTATEKAASE